MANPWTPFYWGDYLADTGHLTLIQHGAYVLLMAHYYRSGRPLPSDLDQVYRICRAFGKEEQSAVRGVLQMFFVLDGGVYRQKRIDAEIGRQQEIAAHYRSRAQIAANARWRGNKDASSNASSTPQAMLAHAYPQPQPQSQSQPQRKSKATNAPDGANSLALPEWLPLESWEGFLENRKKLGVPNSPRALSQVLARLAKAKAEGQDPAALLDEATEKGWRSIYPDKAHGTRNRAERLQQSNIAALNAAIPPLDR